MFSLLFALILSQLFPEREVAMKGLWMFSEVFLPTAAAAAATASGN